MKKDPLTRVCFRLAEKWGVSPRKLKRSMGRKELQEWQMWFRCHPPAGERIDYLMAMEQAKADEGKKPLRKYLPDWGPTPSGQVWEQIKQQFEGRQDGDNS